MFLNKLYVPSKQTHFLCHEMKIRIRKQSTTKINVVLSNKKNNTKAYQSPGPKLPVITISISGYCLILIGWK